ncbi:hypothetical protein PVNG_05559 [Plasmodium vivax North Korean]|uniref:Uncharacterized protein n=1 Tax=Plasmodium vivax North Korean TaxID=1035514 RepID=A0A0J9U309_PLAVI|nr:hypothetical protein PVNG_05559 [Plasmodium vivax North Korean]
MDVDRADVDAGRLDMDVDRVAVNVDLADVNDNRADVDAGSVILYIDQAEFIQGAQHTTPVQFSFDNKPSKPVHYAGLSTLGVIFTSTVLYKV